MTRPTAAVAIPTTGRPDDLDRALRSVLPQATAAGAEVVVVDDGPSEATRTVARRHGARCLEHPRRRGLNASRNAAIDATTADLVCFLDDDVTVSDGWLGALLDAAGADPGAGALGGPVRVVLHGRPASAAERRLPPISALDLGRADRDTDRLWGANLAVRRSAVERIGPFDPAHTMPSGDEEEWLGRLRRDGGRVRYVAAAAVEHHRHGDGARTRALARAQWHRGHAARRADVRIGGGAPGIGAEAATAARNAAALVRHRDAAHAWTTAHALGRLHEALLGHPPAAAPSDAALAGGSGAARAGTQGAADAFLSGTSGLVAGRRRHVLAAHDRLLDARLALTGTGLRLDALAARVPARRVLVVVPARPGSEGRVDGLRRALASDRHDVDLRTVDPAGRPRFRVVEETVGDAAFDWLLVADDDVVLGRRFLDRLLGLVEAAGLDLAQPAHRRHGHAAWPVTRRQPGAVWRRTTFVEIGPVTLVSRRAADRLLPFPAGSGMGWGLDAWWAAVAAEHGWRLGIVDALPVDHTLAPTGSGYDRDDALADARDLLADRAWLPRWEVRTIETHRRPPGGRR